MPPRPPAGLNAREITARKLQLNRSIRLRQAEVARMRIYVPDLYWDRIIAAKEAEIAELQAQRAELDRPSTPEGRERARTYLGFQRYDP